MACTRPSGADRARVGEIAVEPGRPDEGDEAVGRRGDLLDRLARGADESGPEQQILGRIAGRRELGEDDEVGARGRARRRCVARIFSRLPSRSPTTVFSCASAILKVFASQSQTESSQLGWRGVEITFPRHFRGPLTSANGGYACGRLAAFVDADEVEVTLRLPPPLDRPLAVEHDGDGVSARSTASARRRSAAGTCRASSRLLPCRSSRRRQRSARDMSAAGAPTSASASCAACATTASRSGSGRSLDASRCTRRRSHYPRRARRSSGPRSTVPGAYAVGDEGGATSCSAA